MITNQDIKENIKEFAQLDGAFVIDGSGYIRSQSRISPSIPAMSPSPRVWVPVTIPWRQ